MLVHADLRWPPKTGIGLVQTELVARAPESVELSNLNVSGRVGAALSPINLAAALSRRMNRNGVFWSPGFIPPAWSDVSCVVTVHDLTHLHYYTRFHALYYKWVMKPLYRKCRAVICVSDFTRNEFLNWSQMNPNMVFTVHNGVSNKFFFEGQKSEFSFPYVLYVGNRRRYKNLSRLLTAFSFSRLPRDGVRLLLTGEPDPKLQFAAQRLGIQDQLEFSGPVSDEEVSQLYHGARLLSFVSLYEGFGLPILEAMAAGVPVLTSNVSAMPETAGDAAFKVDPTSIEQIIHGLEQLHYDEALRSRLIELGTVNALRFTWSAAAADTWNIVRNSRD